jgi:hypothetical protein
MKVYYLAWLTADGHWHSGAARFLTHAAAMRAGKLLCGDPTVETVEVYAVIVRPVALPITQPVA